MCEIVTKKNTVEWNFKLLFCMSYFWYLCCFSNGERLQKGSTVCEGGCSIASSRCLLISQDILGSAQTISAFIHWFQDELISCQILSDFPNFMN